MPAGPAVRPPARRAAVLAFALPLALVLAGTAVIAAGAAAYGLRQAITRT
ncbi:hypothetical protein [Kitasatospora sp. NPDC057223]